ncbi:ATP-binding protein [Nonomuraea jiangxiensis]|uniref:Histidine kinase-like ATPase domain-containing protein n=1 Tax=Nonomuraea jiangxiensis TaxID=633440 RepID=A0A1G8FBJ2_9ACTN|nr:ATP-binding protein [Nonomuraea jiangxiensis]SDH79473.1 Histidine kinase-like ATPase domain-containing protein [Nonomuraea jiangxiensis]
MSPALNSPKEIHRWCRNFPGTRAQISEARQFVTSYLGDHLETDTAQLIVSELATNAIRHTRSGLPGGRFGVTLHAGSTLLILAVHDEGGSSTPHLCRAEDEDQSGRGLCLVETLSARWGVHGDNAGRTVWALISLTPADQAA